MKTSLKKCCQPLCCSVTPATNTIETTYAK